MNIKILKFIVVFMGFLIFIGVIILGIGIYYKINNCQLNLDAEEDYFMSLTDPNDISKNLLQTLQS